jgi:hypothetical protein
MTLAICVVTSDGVVIAGDSRTTMAVPNTPMRVFSDYTHKVFRVGNVAVATYGWAFLITRTPSSLSVLRTSLSRNPDLSAPLGQVAQYRTRRWARKRPQSAAPGAGTPASATSRLGRANSREPLDLDAA